MSRFTGPLTIHFADEAEPRSIWNIFGLLERVVQHAILIDPLVWDCDAEGSAFTVTVPAGFVSDGASVPSWLWWFMPAWGSRATRAAILHDFICEALDRGAPAAPVIATRRDCDRQFYLALRALGVGPVRGRLLWLGVRAYSITYSVFGKRSPS